MSVKYCHQCASETGGTHPTTVLPDFSTESSSLRGHSPDWLLIGWEEDGLLAVPHPSFTDSPAVAVM